MHWGTPVLVVAFVLLAGCSGAGPPAPDQGGLPTVQPVVVDMAVDERLFVEGSGCGPVTLVCLGYPGGDTWVFATPANGTLLSLQGTIETSPLYPDGVQWTLECRLHDQGDACRMPLAEGSGMLPLDVAIQGVRLPPLTDLYLNLATPQTDGPADLPAEAARSPMVPHLVATAKVEVDAAGNGSVALESKTIELDGPSGPCPVDPRCPIIPGGMEAESRLGLVRSLHITMTWSAQNDLDRDLGLRINGVSCSGGCRGDLQVFGPSPLVIDVPTTNWNGLRFFVIHEGPDEGVYIADSVAGTNVPVHIEGFALVEPKEP